MTTVIYVLGCDINCRITSLTTPDGASTLYGYDYLNRLTDVTSKDANGAATGSVHYAYDPFGRRIAQTAKDASGNVTLDERYVYDGKNLLLVLDGSGHRRACVTRLGSTVERRD